MQTVVASQRLAGKVLLRPTSSIRKIFGVLERGPPYLAHEILKQTRSASSSSSSSSFSSGNSRSSFPKDWRRPLGAGGVGALGRGALLSSLIGYAYADGNTPEESTDSSGSESEEEIDPNGIKTSRSKFDEACGLINWSLYGTGPLWEEKHYKAVVRLIIASPYHAARGMEVLDALAKVGIPDNLSPADVLCSMRKSRCIHVRPYSTFSRDLPREAFFKEIDGVEDEDVVVTMCSPADLYKVLQQKDEFEKEDE